MYNKIIFVKNFTFQNHNDTMLIFYFNFFFLLIFNQFILSVLFYICINFRRTSLLTFFNDILFHQIIDFDFHKNEILKLHQKKHVVAQIVNYFRDTYQIEIIIRTIKRRLQSWNVTIKRIKTNDSSKLRVRITILFFQCDCNDEEILFFLK